MACEHVSLPGGGTAIVCGTRARQRCACGAPATRLCDWIVSGNRSGTCDTPLCATHATSPARGKDLCPHHARAFERWKSDRRRN
tara:strand:- start:1040 stop:1291 length:252 start_codon:yes stop_codon:yes gene_type:complete